MSIVLFDRRVLVWVALSAGCLAVRAAEPQSHSARSPDGSNTITLTVDEDFGPRIQVTRRGREILAAGPLGPRLAEIGRLADGAVLQGTETGTVDETFAVRWGKSREVRNQHAWLRADLKSRGGLAWQIDLAAFDDGVAYRYRLPKPDDSRPLTVADESTEWTLPGNPTVHFTACKRFTTDHESEFRRQPLAALPRSILLDLPLLAVWQDGLAVAVTEARLRDFTSMYLERAAGESTRLRCRLSPLPGKPDVCAVGAAGLGSPWRVVLLGDTAGQLLESNLLLCLNDAPEGDYAWVRPGKTTWHWWNGTAEPGLPFESGMNLATHKRYVDFCAAHGITYHAVVADDRPWHVQAEQDFAPHADTDILTPRPELELPKLLAYARQRGVGIRLWVHWKPLDERLEESFARYQEWGISGLMVDFLDRDDQQMVSYCERVLRSAAAHRLHIQFHGSYKPSGEQRTFPHLFNREGVLNLEYLKWSQRCTPPHNVEVAYTRQLAGPLDYHLGGFRSVSRGKFVARNENPQVVGTRCHHLAMYVIYENPMPMVCDTPSAYEGQTGFEFITEVPTTWDETRFVLGEAGEYIVLARRKGAAWYLGGMTNWTARRLEIPLAFLPAGEFEARLFSDGSLDEEQPAAIRIERRAASADRPLTIALAPGGGFAAVVQPK